MRRVNRVNALEIAVTVVTVAEQMRGWLNIINQSPQSGRLIWAYKGLDNGVKYFNQVRVLEFDQNAANRYFELLQQRIRIGTQDLRIASIVIANNGILVTRNRRDFEKVPGLIFEDWSLDES